MKAIITAAAAAAALLAGAANPASADQPNHYGYAGHGHGYYARPYGYDAHRYGYRRHVVYERPAPPPHYRVYHGREVALYGGHWGYWVPRNGVNVFITVPL
jgi:hypothetical protein